MTSNSETIILKGSRDAIEAINNKIKEQTGSKTLISERRNLEGDSATWIVIATLATQSLPHILNFIKDYVSRDKVKSFKIGDIVIENPTAKMVEDMITKQNNTSNPNG